jgi:hypothetical protein
MLQSYAFRNRDGLLGMFQKEDDVIHLYVDSIFYTYTCRNWSEWTQQVTGGHDARFIGGDILQPTEKSIGFYLLQFCEHINIDVLDLVEIQNPGFFFPRISRGNFEFNYVGDGYYQDIRAYQAIQNSLDDLLYVVEPSVTNFDTYGHKIRELLILACTEVEYLLLRVLMENGYPQKKTYNTTDYIQCLPILKLNEYRVLLGQYPNLKKFEPFSNWNTQSTTQSLEWYDAYNSVKHNRGGSLKNANFKHLLDAIAAIHILLEAQYGKNIFNRLRQYKDAKSVFESINRPNWSSSEISAPIFNGYEIDTNWIGALRYFVCNPIPSKAPKPKCTMCGK